ncbi:MAG: hypothetical protein JSU08_06775 [Acidobacteria bacterium]|nr:hypothetical protein [Acidobacteriota bacterium]
MHTGVVRTLAALALATSAAAPVLAQPASAALARELTTTLAARHLDAFAARDPQAADGFVAALLYPNVQLLVVSGRYPAPDALAAQLQAGRFQEAYAALQGNAVPDSKLFVQDMQADGLRGDADQTPDIVYEKVVTQTILNGNPKSGDYRKTLKSKDEAYSRALQVLLEALKSQPAGQDVASAR